MIVWGGFDDSFNDVNTGGSITLEPIVGQRLPWVMHLPPENRIRQFGPVA